jgi:hypothetical protein
MRTRHGNVSFVQLVAAVAVVCAFSRVALAQSEPGPLYANEPRIEFPPTAVAQCLSGRVVVRYRLVDNVPTDVEILDSAPGDLYVDAFRRWLLAWHGWRAKAHAYEGSFASSQPIEKTYRFEPCER